MKREIVYLSIIAILSYMLIMKGCQCRQSTTVEKPGIKIVEKIRTVKGDTVYKPVPKIVYKNSPPKTVHVHDTIPVLEPGPEQSLPATDYITSVYSDTLKMGADGYAIVNDSVNGSILSRKFSYSINHRETTITKTIPAKKRIALLFGPEIHASQTGLLSYGGQIGLQLKNGNIMLAGTGLQNNQQYFKAGILLKLKLKKQ